MPGWAAVRGRREPESEGVLGQGAPSSRAGSIVRVVVPLVRLRREIGADFWVEV